MSAGANGSQTKGNGPTRQPLRVLIIEDSEDDCLLVVQQLRRSGFQPEYRRVFTPEAMQEALEAEPWDLVVCDYAMPRFSAPAALEVFQKRQIDIPFIVVSGTVGETLAVDTMIRGAHDYLMKDRLGRLGQAVRREMAQARERAERRKSEQQREHLTRVLAAIRNVNQLIVREKDSRRLVQQACDTLVETRGFKGAWIVLSAAPGGEPASGRSRVPEEAFSRFVSLFQSGDLPPCCRRSSSSGEPVLFTRETRVACAGCPLAGIYNGASALTVRIAHEGRLYGYLGVSLPGDLTANEEELSLFQEVAGDLGFALHMIGVEAERDKSERTLRAIFEAAADGMLLAEVESGRFIVGNRAICQMLGCSAAEIATLSCSDIHPSEDLPRVAAVFKKQAEGEITLAPDLPVKRRDGSVFPADISSAPIELDGRLHLLGIFRDVSERKRAEEKLRENVESLRGARERLVQQARWLQALNSVAGEIARRNSLDSILQVALGHLQDSFETVLAGVCLSGEEESFCTVAALGARGRSLAGRIGLKLGSRTSLGELLHSTSPAQGVPRTVYLEEVVSASLSEEALTLVERLRKQRLQAITTVNLEYEELRTGLLFMLFRDRHNHSEMEYRFLKGMAEYVSVAVQNRRLYEELESSYRKLQQTQAVMMEQERMKAMGQMASGVAHDINNTLAPITLYVEALMASELAKGEPANRYLATIQSAVGDIEGITHRLRAFYKHEEAEELEPVDLGQVIEAVVELTRPRWKDIPNRQGIEVSLETEVSPRLPPILGNRTEVREALINLVFNAVDALPEGGLIRVRAAKHGKGAEQRLLLEVCDEGIGMGEEQRRRCLEPFYSTKGAEGTGLGLAVVYGAVQRHKGEIQIESAPGKGTTVRLLFPLPHRPLEKSRPKDEPPVKLPPLRILCVDDNPSVREVLQEMLREHGHSVESFQRGEEAIGAFKAALEADQGFQLVITDLGMPHMDGKEVAGRIKEISPETPVILLSGWSNFLNLERELPQHIDCVLAKPATMARLLPAIGELIRAGGRSEAGEDGR